MYIMIVNFNLVDMTEVEYFDVCDQLAPSFAEIPGLVSKVWLADLETNTYGGVYTWQDRQAMLAFQNSELFHAVATNPNFTNITSQEFSILEVPTRVTHGLGVFAH